MGYWKTHISNLTNNYSPRASGSSLCHAYSRCLWGELATGSSFSLLTVSLLITETAAFCSISLVSGRSVRHFLGLSLGQVCFNLASGTPE